MASSAGSDVTAIVALLAICLAVLLILRHYIPLRTTPAYLIVPIFLALALPSSAILLVPIDLASSARQEDEATKGIWLPARAVLVSWRIIYWLTFVLTWLVLPLLGEYMDAGYREPESKMKYSLRTNARYQLITLGSAAIGLIYMIISYGFDFTALKGLIMALAYTWGLILAIYLMGHGLVALPRQLYRHADIAGRLRMVQSHAPRVHEKLEDAIISLEDVEVQIQQLQQRKTGTARHFQDWIDELADQTGQMPGRVTLATPNLAAATIPNVITERYLADLTRRFNRARQQRARYVDEWDDTVRTASRLQTILDSKASGNLTFGRPGSSSLFARYASLHPRLRFHMHIHIIPALRYLFCAIFGLASIAIIQSELIRPFVPQYSIVSLTVIHHPKSDAYQIGFGGQFLASFWIMYMVFCALSSMTVVPTWNQRALVRRKTYAESACWYAGQVAKLTVPLAYNFLTFLPTKIQTNTTFDAFLGRLINLTPFGEWFSHLFPMLILIPVCATLFNLYGRVKRVFGFGFISDEEDEETSAFGGGWREGRDLIARDLAGPNHASSSLGLTDSPRASYDSHNNRPGVGGRSQQPTLWVPPADRSRSLSPNPSTLPITRTAASSIAAANQRSRSNRGPVILDPEPEEENFFTLFGKRVKNTFDTIETPKWMQKDSNQQESSSGGSVGGGSSSTGGFKRPKWMGGSSDEFGAGRGNDGEGFIDRLFGGNNNNNSNSRMAQQRGGGNTRNNDGRIVS